MCMYSLSTLICSVHVCLCVHVCLSAYVSVCMCLSVYLCLCVGGCDIIKEPQYGTSNSLGHHDTPQATYYDM